MGVLMSITTLCAYGQDTYSHLTDHVKTERMVWSESDNEYLFFDLEERHIDKCFWVFTFNKNRTGDIKMTNAESGDVYTFKIYNWEIRKNNDGREYIWIDVIQSNDSQKLTIIFTSYDTGKMISVFMPDDKLAVFFDNLDD